MREINSDAKTIRQLLDDVRYDLDYYQREYVWTDKQVSELITDLTTQFSKNFDETHARTEVNKYSHYFLGSIVIREEGTKRFIIDGQQRLTTLSLFLIFLYHSLEDESQKGQVRTLIFSMRYGEKSFNLDILERESVMEVLFSAESLESFLAINQPESIQNIAGCYKQIQKLFDFPKHVFPYFVDWLLEKVYLVEITSFTEDDAYTIFETMNDRGLSLTDTEMLRGYLLSNITNLERRNKAKEVWDLRIQELKQIGKDEESEAIKAWLRGQHANTVRDFERIGAEFHRWVRDPENEPGLTSIDAIANFIERDFTFYSSWYSRLRDAANSLTYGLECIYYNAQNNFTLQYPILLSPLNMEDTEEEALRKIQIVATYLDIFIHRHIWNGNSIAQNTMSNYIWRDQHVTNEYTISPIIPFIRGKSSKQLGDILYKRIKAETKPFGTKMLHLHNQNRRKIRLILARMTDYVGVESEQASHYKEYIRTGTNSYEVEHIWANNFEWHLDDFSHQSEFEIYRDRIGGLLLLPKKINASFGDLPYTQKREHYLRENLLAQSLHEKAYQNNPGFLQFIENSGLPFQPHSEFKKVDLDSRQELYQLLAMSIWNPELLRIPYGETPTLNSNEVEGPNIRQDSLATKRIANLVPPERREFYNKTHSSHNIHECYSMIAELQNLIQEKRWNLDLKFRNYYCAFYFGSRCVFGINLYSSPRYAVWMTEAEAERESLRNRCKFANYSTPLGHAVYPRNTTVDSLRPIFEFAYKKHQNIDVVSQ